MFFRRFFTSTHFFFVILMSDMYLFYAEKRKICSDWGGNFGKKTGRGAWFHTVQRSVIKKTEPLVLSFKDKQLGGK